MRTGTVSFRSNARIARKLWNTSHSALRTLRELTQNYSLSIAAGDLQLLDGKWYVTHAGLLRISQRNRCSGIPKQQLREIGWTKATELAKVARREGERFESATWLHRAQVLPKEEFKREVERHLTGKETEAWEIVYFKLYKSQLPVVERALETAGLMLGTDKSRGYCLEMICADFLAGAFVPENQP